MKQSYKYIVLFILLALLASANPVNANQSVILNEVSLPDIEIPTDVAFLTLPDVDQIQAFNWPIGAVVKVSIDDPATTDPDYTTEAVVADDGFDVTLLEFDLGGVFDILPGHIITLNDGVTTKIHIVTDLAFSNIDLITDLVTGIGEPESEVEVWVCWTDGCTGNRLEGTDLEGNWVADFADAEQAVFDIGPGNEVAAVEWDADGNGTLAKWMIPDPVLLSPADDTIIEIDTPVFQWEETTGATGYGINIIQISTGEAAENWFEVGDGITCEGGVCSFQLDIPLPNDAYEWTVQPWIDDYDTLYYDQFIFNVDIIELEETDSVVEAVEEAEEVEEVEDEDEIEEFDPVPSKLGFPVSIFGNRGPGLVKQTLYAGQIIDVGTVSIWNSRYNLQIQTEITKTEEDDGWLISEIHIFVGTDPVITKSSNPIPGKFPYKREFENPNHMHMLVVDFEEDMGFSWGLPWEADRVQNIAVHADLVKLDEYGEVIAEEGAWAFGPNEYEGDQWGWWSTYQMAHPKRGHFIDSPVGGLSFTTPTHYGNTDESGGFDYFPGERVELSVGSVHLGTPLADHKISPLDIYPNADTDDPRVINMARLLQSLDADADPKEGIYITDDVVTCLDQAVFDLGLTDVNFADDAQTEAVIQGTIGYCPELVSVSAEDAKANLDRSLDTAMFRKNISRTPDLTSSKSKLNIMGVWFPALRANNDPTVVEYYDENGALIRTAEEAKPVVVTYTDGVPETGYEDIFTAISRDDGNTFKRMNISRAADRTSFTLENGEEYYGQAKKPVFQVKGNNILVAWTSKFCKGGKPAYSIDPVDDYIYDDPYYTEDIWGVGGPQRSVDYAEQGFPEVGEVPYSCVWVARGTIVTQGMINSGGFWADKLVGEIVWFKPERLTSGRRDANQVFMGASDGAGFAIAWQEDPGGLRPGAAAGPGPGWGGATTNHKTDIWYSYITMADFRTIDSDFVSGGDPEHDIEGRPKALVPMALPVRLSDNDAVNTDNLLVELGEDGYPIGDGPDNWIPLPNSASLSDGDGTHAYAYEIEGLCEGFYEFTNYNDELKRVCITEDGRLLDGNTGASRPNVFLQTYTKPDGTKSAWAILAYEETKGAGIGPPDHTEDPPYGDEPLPEVGKNAIYHSFDFQNPDLVSAGNIINLPERDADGNLMYQREVSLDGDGNLVYGELILDYLGQPQLAYENARRPRFIIQGKAAAGASNTVMLVLYKEGQDGMGRPSDIFLRRFVSDTPGNPYSFGNIICNAWELADNGLTVCVDGAQNMSTVNPILTTPSMGDPTSEDPWGAVKVLTWEQTPEILANASWVNPYEEARAHRGAIRGDFIVMGYSYTPNWAAARNGNDKYDFYIRRSFDGGLTWTTDPVGSGVEHCRTWTDPVTKIKTEDCTSYLAGAFEEARNVSQLPNNKESVIEPRIVGAPGTIKVDGVWTGIDEDKQNKNVFYVSYGTSTNPPIVHGDSDEEQEYPAPLDLFYSFSQDRGETLVEVAWDVNPDSDGNFAGETVYRWDFLAKGDPEQGEAQLRMTPDGSRFYAIWLQEGEEGSDIWFRRIMSPVFPANVATSAD